jgi:hypothetical protein
MRAPDRGSGPKKKKSPFTGATAGVTVYKENQMAPIIQPRGPKADQRNTPNLIVTSAVEKSPPKTPTTTPIKARASGSARKENEMINITQPGGPKKDQRNTPSLLTHGAVERTPQRKHRDARAISRKAAITRRARGK